MELEIGKKYKWKHSQDELIYIGKKGCWHQFKKIGDARGVWCEVLEEDLYLLESIDE